MQKQMLTLFFSFIHFYRGGDCDMNKIAYRYGLRYCLAVHEKDRLLAVTSML